MVKKEDLNGFGKSVKGTVIHIIEDGKAKCDKKIKGVIIDNNLSIKDITCAKCKRFKIYIDAIVASLADDDGKKEEPKTKPSKKKETKPSKKKEVGIKTYDKKKEVKSKPVKEPEVKEPAFIVRSITRKKEENICIIHKATGKVFFDHLDRRVVYDAIKNLNKIPLCWDLVTDKMPKGFITKCRKALRKAYELCDIKTPKGLRESKDGLPKKYKKRKKERRAKIKRRTVKVKEKVRKIKRRVKKNEPIKRIIKRRTKKENEKLNKHKVKPKTDKTNEIEKLIAKKVKDGSVFSELTGILKSQYGLKINQAKAMIEGTVLTMSRQLGIPVFIALGKTKEDDFYSL